MKKKQSKQSQDLQHLPSNEEPPIQGLPLLPEEVEQLDKAAGFWYEQFRILKPQYGATLAFVLVKATPGAEGWRPLKRLGDLKSRV